MPDTRQELEFQLRKFQGDKRTNEEAIRETRTLLGKADKRRRDDPDEKSKWGQTLDNLETTLSEKKRMLTVCETSIQQITRKLKQGDYVDDESEEEKPEEPAVTDVAEESEPMSVPENLSLDDLKAAVKRILSTHIIKVHSIDELDFRLGGTK